MKIMPAHFELREFRCPCCGHVRIASALVLYLEFLRRAWDGPIAVNSGFRCAQRNAAVKGSEHSRHMIGCAADIRPHDLAILDVFKTLIHHTTAGLAGWEVLEYGTFVHVAVPRTEAMNPWAGGSIRLV